MNQQNQNPYLNLYQPQLNPQMPQQQPYQGYAPQAYGASYPGNYQGNSQGNSQGNYQPRPMPSSSRSQSNSGLLGDRFLKGLLIGAAAAYILTNESVQRTAIKGAVKAWSLLQGGVEEIKERFHDAEAELRAESGE